MVLTLALACVLAGPPQSQVVTVPDDQKAQELAKRFMAFAETMNAADGLVAREAKACGERHERIGAELRGIAASDLPADHWGRRWAGRYARQRWRDDVMELSIAPGAGATLAISDPFKSSRDSNSLRRVDHGDVRLESPESVVVSWAIDPKLFEVEQLRGPLYFANVLGTRALLTGDDLTKLVGELNEGRDAGELLHRCLRHKDDIAAPHATCELDLPKAWRALIIDHPVTFTTTRVTALEPVTDKGWIRTDFRIELDAGSDRGVYVGMSFPFTQGTATGRLEIDKVGPTTSEGLLRVWSNKGMALEAPAPGQAFSLSGIRLPAAPASSK